MARRRTARRRNPGRRSMLLVNPRKRRSTRKRPTRRRNSLVVRANPRRRRPVRRRAASRRRNPVRRRRTARRAVARRNPRRRTYAAKRRRNSSKRRAPKVVYRYRAKNPKRRRKNTRRRNPGFAATLRKVPVVGPMLASMAGFTPQAIFGALSVEPTMWIAKMAAPYVPMVPASLFYPITGLFTAALVQYLPFGSPAMKKQLAIAVASAAGGVGYYKARTGADAEMAAEAGMLELRGVGNLGSVLTIRPQLAGAGYGYAYNPVQMRSNAYSDGGAYQVRPF